MLIRTVGEKVTEDLRHSFFGLTADRILNVVEASLHETFQGSRATGVILALNSLENRVHEIEFENHKKVVSKFYRPERWNEAQLQDEHLFLKALEEAEVPVVCPLPLQPGPEHRVTKVSTLGQTKDGIYFAVFPKVRGRLLDELSTSQLETLGRYLGRIYQVGKVKRARHRLTLSVKAWGEDPLLYLQKNGNFDSSTWAIYESVVRKFLKRAEQSLKGVAVSTVHGDCHLGNTLWNEESPFFLDFDDLMNAPPVQDIWMVVRGRGPEADEQRSILLRSYESMCEFDWETLSLIEVLRGLRIIHYSAWILRRLDDPSFKQAFPSFGSNQYWRSEIEAIDEINQLIGALG